MNTIQKLKRLRSELREQVLTGQEYLHVAEFINDWIIEVDGDYQTNHLVTIYNDYDQDVTSDYPNIVAEIYDIIEEACKEYYAKQYEEDIKRFSENKHLRAEARYDNREKL